MAIYLKLFLAAAIPYALFAILVMNSLTGGLLFGAFLGLMMSALFGTLQHLSFRGKKADASRDVNQSLTIEIDASYQDAFDLCLDSHRELLRATILSYSRETGIIELRTGRNWTTYGERLTLTVRHLPPRTAQITITSQPRVKTTMVDFGRNLQNVNHIAVFLRERSAADHLSLEKRTRRTPASTRHTTTSLQHAGQSSK